MNENREKGGLYMDAKWERRLGISTAAAAFEKDDKNHSRYEPTSYTVLERLARSRWISREDVVVDYGCGKGRVGFYLNHVLGCRTIGVEYDEKLCLSARENLRAYTGSRDAIEFACANAEAWAVPREASCFYFFNPFSVKILQGVLGRILESWYEFPREMKLFFYYMLDGTRSFMMAQDAFSYAGEVDCGDCFHNADEKERIVIFTVG